MLLTLLLTLVANSPARAPHPPRLVRNPPKKPPALLTAKPLQDDPKDDELRKLLKARYNEALGEAKAYHEFGKLGVDTIINLDDLYGRWQRLVQARLELCDKPTEKVELLSQYVELTKELEKADQSRLDAHRIPKYELHRARYQRLDAEVQLLRAKREADKTKGK